MKLQHKQYVFYITFNLVLLNTAYFYSMPSVKLLLLVFLIPVKLFSQDVTGIWAGIIHNDSTNLDLPYELLIFEQKGKTHGYSYTNFMVDGKELTGVKKLKITKADGKIFLQDDELIYDNYPFTPPKGVKQLTTLAFSTEGGVDVLSGKFFTSRTKQYGKPVTGTINLTRKEVNASKLIPILNNLSVYWGQNKEPDQSKAVAAIPRFKKEAAANIPTPVADPVRQLAKRKVETIQNIFITSDSLLLELFDNGYVDGDSVSIIVNGKVLLSNQRLGERAISKMMYVKPAEGDSLHIVMFAENLGSIAPNSGVAVIHDGNKRHEISFSGDLQKNAAIILKRRKQK